MCLHLQRHVQNRDLAFGSESVFCKRQLLAAIRVDSLPLNMYEIDAL